MAKAGAKANRHIGSSLDELLAEDKVPEDVSARAMKRVLASQVQQGMKQRGLTKMRMAKRMRTSRSALDRLLDETDTGLRENPSFGSRPAALAQASPQHGTRVRRPRRPR